MSKPITLRATVPILHLGAREGDVITWHPAGLVTVTRAVDATADHLASLVQAGVLTPSGPLGAVTAEIVLRQG